MKQNPYIAVALLAVSLFFGLGRVMAAELAHPVSYKTVEIDDVEIFYREAGDPAKPTIVLLHGFPTSGHMFRELIPRLADRYHAESIGAFMDRTATQPVARSATLL
jgi:hypothetical protein